ncbi:hypothetical protein D3C85_1899070 [compost metagenome]
MKSRPVIKSLGVPGEVRRQEIFYDKTGMKVSSAVATQAIRKDLEQARKLRDFGYLALALSMKNAFKTRHL